jgi:glycerol-3-phosphate acyltransferase PlsY
MTATIILLILASYLGGGIPIGLIAGQVCCKTDVRLYGSKNIGASNVWRTLGWRVGIPVFILDVGKGLLPVMTARHYPEVNWLPVAAGFAAIMGHNFSPFLGFKGGKGVATTLGVALGLSWQAGLIAFAVWTVVLLITRMISVSSMAGAVFGCFFIWWNNDQHIAYGIFAVLATLFVFVKHRSNIERIRHGTEARVTFRFPFSRTGQGA